MPNISPDIFQISIIAALFLLFIKEFFGFLKSRKNNKNGDEVLEAIQLMKSNHLSSLDQKINRLDDKLDKVINILIEIKVKLSK